MDGWHHLHMRKRLSHKAREPFPARTPLLRALDKIMFVVAFIAPVALLPQALRIYEIKSAAGLSIYTWLALVVYNALWTLYGFAHKEKLILIANFLITALNVVVVFGIFIYG